MSPNPYTAIKWLVSPHKWLSSHSSSPKPKNQVEHWSKSAQVPIPGYYEHRPGRGWYLITADNIKDCHNVRLPTQVTYCRILHRWMLTTEFEKRRRQETIKHAIYCNGAPKNRGFFLLDDGRTYIMAWNSTGEFILKSGRIQGWCIDEKTRHLRPMEPKDHPKQPANEDSGSSRDTSVGWAASRNASITASRNTSIASGALAGGHVCTSCNTSKAASTFTTESKNSTAYTTPCSPVLGRKDDESEEVCAEELRDKLTVLWERQPEVAQVL
jgi:hypothetical protein